MSTSGFINFSSENFAGIHPEIMQALLDANKSHEPSYGKDRYTISTVSLFKKHFGEDIHVYFTFNGTGANNFGLSCITEKFQSIICSDVAHLYVDESTAPESATGCRLYPVPSQHGKITASDLKFFIKRKGDVHHPQPRVVSLTQPTEYGTVYTLSELRNIKQICVENDLLLHVDGSRFFNAAVHLDISLETLSRNAGIDVLTLGGTKAGMMFGEAVIFFGMSSGASHKFYLKRSMQLASKQRFIAAQFKAILENDLWHRIATHTNRLAKKFGRDIANIASIEVLHPVESNAVFLKMPGSLFQNMRQHANFYQWNEQKDEVRIMFSFDNSEDDIQSFMSQLKRDVQKIM